MKFKIRNIILTLVVGWAIVFLWLPAIKAATNHLGLEFAVGIIGLTIIGIICINNYYIKNTKPN